MFAKEDYVSFGVAKLLKEKGFECVTGWAYIKDLIPEE